MSCIGSILKQLLDFTYVRSKDDEKIISIDSIDINDDLNGSDDQDRGNNKGRFWRLVYAYKD